MKKIIKAIAAIAAVAMTGALAMLPAVAFDAPANTWVFERCAATDVVKIYSSTAFSPGDAYGFVFPAVGAELHAAGQFHEVDGAPVRIGTAIPGAAMTFQPGPNSSAVAASNSGTVAPGDMVAFVVLPGGAASFANFTNFEGTPLPAGFTAIVRDAAVETPTPDITTTEAPTDAAPAPDVTTPAPDVTTPAGDDTTAPTGDDTAAPTGADTAAPTAPTGATGAPTAPTAPTVTATAPTTSPTGVVNPRTGVVALAIIPTLIAAGAVVVTAKKRK